MEFFLTIFLVFMFSFSRGQDIGEWETDQSIHKYTGQSFHLLYTTIEDLKHCKFSTPEGIELDLDDDLGSEKVKTEDKRPPGWTYTWYGTNEKRDCGIQINNAAMNDSGPWTVVAGIKDDVTVRKTSVTILELVAPDRIILNPNTTVSMTIEPKTDPAPINITCIAYETRGNVTFTWRIGKKALTGEVIANYYDKITPELPDSFMNAIEVFQYVPAPSHDNQRLKCEANHSKYTKDDLANKTNIATINITVLASPVAQENIVFENHDLGNQSIEIQFHSNPPPTSIYWEMHDMQHPIRDKQIHGRYASLGWKSLGNGDYIATIRVSNLSESDEDVDHPNHLFVKNDIGETSYNFTFTFPPQPAKLAVGEIAGIVLGCLGAVCLIWLVVSQVRKRRKSKNITQEGEADNREEMRETPRTQREED